MYSGGSMKNANCLRSLDYLTALRDCVLWSGTADNTREHGDAAAEPRAHLQLSIACE